MRPDRDRRAAENFARAPEEAGVERVIYLGGLGRRGRVCRNTSKAAPR